MRKLLSTFFTVGSFALVFTSCSKSENGSTTTVPPVVTADSIKVILSQNTIEKNDFEAVTITVKDKNNADITSSSTIYVDGVSATSNVFYPYSTKSFAITAKKGTLASNVATLAVTAPTPSPFTQKLLVEDYTGTWCQYCPRVAANLESYVTTKPACITVGVHGGSTTEPFAYQYITQMTNAISLQGWPTAILNRNTGWGETAAELNAELGKWAPLGLSIESAVSGSTITGKVSVKYNVTTAIPMKIMVMLVESGLVYPQVNYYSSPGATPYYGPNPIASFEHKNVLRKVLSSDILKGEDIPVAAQIKGATWDKTFSFTTTGVTANNAAYTVNTANAKIVAFVQYGTNDFYKVGVINVQAAPVGTVKAFD